LKNQYLIDAIQSTKNPHEYRLFSVVEHVGNFASRGHYICYNLDSEDNWILFDDNKVKKRDLDSVLDSQAYILFYELIE